MVGREEVARALVLLAALAALTACSDDAGDGAPDASTSPDASSSAHGDASATSTPTEDAAASADAGERSEVLLPDGAEGIGFDDLQYSQALDRLLVPAGRAGYVGLLDPKTEQVTRLGSFSVSDAYASGHDFGTTSAIEAEGLVYAIDRSTLELQQLDPESGELLATVTLGASPDYVRFVPTTREIWVTEPVGGRFEIFALTGGEPPVLEADGELAIAGGPESMAVAPDGATVYTNSFLGQTVQVDAATRSETVRWSNTCVLSLGLALDETGQRVFVGCQEGKAVALDAADGSVLSTLAAGGGVDIIAYSATRGHLYLNGSTKGELTVAGVDPDGMLSELATVPTAPSTNSSCVASDPYDNVWVCDANAGRLWRITDVY